MNVIQLNTPILMQTPLGKGYAIIFESDADDHFWTIALNDTCAIVTFKQDQIRIDRSYTYGRGISNEEMKTIITKEKRK